MKTDYHGKCELEAVFFPQQFVKD